MTLDGFWAVWLVAFPVAVGLVSGGAGLVCFGFVVASGDQSLSRA